MCEELFEVIIKIVKSSLISCCSFDNQS